MKKRILDKISFFLAVDLRNSSDAQKLLDGDLKRMRIFSAYTTRIPWVLKEQVEISREDEACYSFLKK
jgi:hypothetical protein